VEILKELFLKEFCLGYALSHLANIHTGTPERPLSTQGLLCYRKYWKSKIFDYLITKTKEEQIVINGLYYFVFSRFI
jgi:hypothetical protein